MHCSCLLISPHPSLLPQGEGTKNFFQQTIRTLLLTWLFIGLTGCTSMFFQPHRQQIVSPERLGLQYEDVYIKVDTDVTLHAWFLPAASKTKGTIFFLHGNAENISTHIGSVYWLPEAGYNVFLLDYRGYGRSQGQASLDYMLSDLDQAFAYVLKRADVDPERVVILGQSLGGALAVYFAAHSQQRDKIRALTIDSTFSSYQAIVQEKMDSIWLTWPLQWLPTLTIGREYDPVTAIADLPQSMPVLIMHGDQDPIVPPHHAEVLFAAAREPKELWLLPGKRHIESFRDQEVRQRWLEYLQRVLPVANPRLQDR